MKTRCLYGVLALAALLGACEQESVELEEVIRPVRSMRVVSVGAGETRIFSGVTKAALETDLSFKVSGLVTSLDAVVGNTVKLGQVVAKIDPTDYQVRLRESEAGLERARAEERSAQAAFDRTRELYENRNASRSDLDTSRAMAESAEALVRASGQQLEAVRLQLSYTILTSPQVCTVARRHVEINQNVSAGQSIVRLNCGDCPEVRVDVPGVFIGRIENGATVGVTVASLPGKQFTGVVTEIGVGTEQNRSIYPVTVLLQNGCATVRSGMAADVTLKMAGPDEKQSSLLVPIVSVGEDADGNFVFVLEPGSDGEYTAGRRGVTIGPPTAQGIEIVQGVSEGELIATAGVRRLAEGQTVTLLGMDDG